MSIAFHPYNTFTILLTKVGKVGLQTFLPEPPPVNEVVHMDPLTKLLSPSDIVASLKTDPQLERTYLERVTALETENEARRLANQDLYDENNFLVRQLEQARLEKVEADRNTEKIKWQYSADNHRLQDLVEDLISKNPQKVESAKQSASLQRSSTSSSARSSKPYQRRSKPARPALDLSVVGGIPGWAIGKFLYKCE